MSDCTQGCLEEPNSQRQKVERWLGGRGRGWGVGGGQGEGSGELVFSGDRDLVLEDDKVLEMDGADSQTTT